MEDSRSNRERIKDLQRSLRTNILLTFSVIFLVLLLLAALVRKGVLSYGDLLDQASNG